MHRAAGFAFVAHKRPEGEKENAMANQKFVPTKAAALTDLAATKNESGEYIFEDLGPAIPVEELFSRPERPYLVEGVLTQGALALLSAESFVGKTFFAMELARAVATGTLFMNKYRVRRGGVLYIAQDGSDEEYVRQWKKIAGHHWGDHRAALLEFQEDCMQAPEERRLGAEPPHDAFRGRIRFEFNHALGIDNSDDLQKIALTALRMEHSLGEVLQCDPDDLDMPPYTSPDHGEQGVRLVIFDAGHSVFFGDENSSGEVQNVMTNLRQLANATGATVLLLVHLNKYSSQQRKQGVPPVHENRVRGSGVFQSAPDWHMQLHKGKADDEVYAFQLKDRAGNRCKSFIYGMTFEDLQLEGVGVFDGKATLRWVRDLTREEHRERQVGRTLVILPDPIEAVRSEFAKDSDMSIADIVMVLRTLPQFTRLADSTLEDKAKDILSGLETEGFIHQTRQPARGKKALYRKRANTGEASA